MLIENCTGFTLQGDDQATPPKRSAPGIIAFADVLDDAAEELERATVVRKLDALARRRARAE